MAVHAHGSELPTQLQETEAKLLRAAPALKFCFQMASVLLLGSMRPHVSCCLFGKRSTPSSSSQTT